MILEEKYTLSNGIDIPKLGLGTWFISNENAGQAVKDAVKIGYRHIDTAQAYSNEGGVGEGQLRFHLGAAMNTGLTQAQMKDFISILKSMVGKAQAKNAQKILTEVLNNRK